MIIDNKLIYFLTFEANSAFVQVSHHFKMPRACAICRKTKGNIRIPSDEKRKKEWLSIVGLLPADTKVENVRICFQHFHREDLTFVGNQLRASKGKFFFKMVYFFNVNLSSLSCFKKDGCQNRRIVWDLGQ